MKTTMNVAPGISGLQLKQKANQKSTVKIVSVQSASALKQFVHFPYKLYRKNPYWVPPIEAGELKFWDEDYNPLLKKSRYELFLAFRKGKIVGRIACLINEGEASYGIKAARFGWLDFIDDRQVSYQLIQQAVQWAQQQGMDHINGPLGFTNLDSAGMLTKGFSELSNSTTLYTYPYYREHLEELGMEEDLHWVEYEFPVIPLPEKLLKMVDLLTKRYEMRVIKFEKKSDMEPYYTRMMDLVKGSYSQVKSYVSLDDKDLEFYLDRFKPILIPEYCALVENKEGELVGFGIATPSLSKALQKSGGRIFPLGWYHLQKAFKQNDRAEMQLIGVRPDMQNKGVTALIMTHVWQSFLDKEIKWVESNPELVTNTQIHNLWKSYDKRQHKERKTYRLSV